MSDDYFAVDDRHDNDKVLTARELEVLSWFACGLNYKQIAQRLWLSPTTVSTHLERVRHKMRVHTTAEAVQIALKAGQIPVGMSR